MVSFHHGWLFIEEENGYQNELFNHARTAAYLQSSEVLGCGHVYGVLDDGGCPAYRWVPPLTMGEDVLIDEVDGYILTDPYTGEILIGAVNQSESGWYQQNYSNPIDDSAPWYNAAFPESGEALGFWVTEWTGLDSGHVRREMTNVGSYGGGGVFGAMGSTAREMGFEVILIGESERALDYLYRWLDATLSSVCATCATDTILIRRFCPEVDELDFETAAEGVVEMRGVGLMSGMQWGAPPVERAGCYMRRVNFTMAATDPCMYGYCTDTPITQDMGWDTCFAAANLSEDRTSCRPSCSELEGLCRIAFDFTVSDPSASAPIVTITPPFGVASMPVRVRTYANGNAFTPSELCGAPLLGELYLTSLPAYSELRYDVSARKVEIRTPGTGGFINGFGYVAPNDPGVPRFFALGCGDYTTVIEPADLCYAAASTVTNGLQNSAYRIHPLGSDVFVAGEFTTARGTTMNRVTKLTPDGQVITTFNAGGTVGVDGTVQGSAVQTDGKIIIGGDFTNARGTVQNRLARLAGDGSLDTTFNTGGTVGVTARPRAIVVQPDGKIFIGGDFVSARGTVKNYFARLETDGTLDAAFNIGGTVGADNSVYCAVLLGTGEILVAGDFLNMRGTLQNRISRLETDGTLDASFNTGGTVGVNGVVRCMAVQTDGKILIGGDFTLARGTAVYRIARLEADGTLDVAFNIGGTVGVSGSVYCMAVLPDGKILIGGDFLTARGTTVNRIARLETDGTLDATFNIGGTVGLNGIVRTIHVRPDGKVLAGGDFTTARGTTANRIVLLNEDGSYDTANFNTTQLVNNQLAFVDAEMSVRTRMGCA